MTALEIISLIEAILTMVNRLAGSATELNGILKRAQENGGEVLEEDRDRAEELVKAARADLQSAIADATE